MSSRYIQVTPWALLEYEYANQPITVNSTKVLRINNQHTQSFQFINGNIALNQTANVFDRSAVAISSLRNKWAYTDIDAIVPYINTDIKITVDDLSNNLSSSSINYDVVKIHLVSGFNLEGLDGLIANVQFQDLKGNLMDAAVHVFRTGETQIEFNSSPIFLGDRLYDRYIEFKVPALSFINNEFNSNPANSQSLAFQYTAENLGFNPESLIKFTLYEINNSTVENGNIFLIPGNNYEVSFLPFDQFGLLSSVVRESGAGDFFEFFATFDSGLPETYIASLNSVGGNWAIVHQIEVFEQVGTDFFKTSNFTMLQDNQFDKPILYRPIIVNANLAFSFSLEYTMRFFNRADGQQIIRKASVTSFEPKKYGRQIEQISVQNGYRPVKVYNKIVTAESGQEQSTATNFIQNSPGLSKTFTETKYIPTFFNNTNISITTVGKDAQELDNIIFSQGKAIILLNEYDNRIRFKIYDRNISDNQLEPLNLSTNSFLRLSFITDNGQKIYIDQKVSQDIDPLVGEIEFLIDGEISQKILIQKDKRFFIISSSDDNATDETVVYQGRYENFSNRSKVIEEFEIEKNKEISEKIKQLEKLQKDFESKKLEAEESIAINQNLIAQQELLLNENELIQSENNDQRKKLQLDSVILDKGVVEQTQFISDAIKNKINFKIKEIPGNSVDFSTSLNRIAPKVIKPYEPNTNIALAVKNFSKKR